MRSGEEAREPRRLKRRDNVRRSIDDRHRDLADGVGLRKSNDFNRLRKQTALALTVENQHLSRALANRIRELAGEVRRIGRGNRCDAESIAIDKDCIAFELGSLAGRLEQRQ